MPATSPALNRANQNYPPQVGQTIADALDNGMPFWLALPFAFGTADAAALFTVPAGYRLHIHRAAWEIAVSLSGGTSSAIGISSDDASASTKGDILGGSTGDVAATLVSTGVPVKGGTIGAKFGSNGCVVLAAGKVVRFDKITSAFTAGNGLVHLWCSFQPTA